MYKCARQVEGVYSSRKVSRQPSSEPRVYLRAYAISDLQTS